MAVNKFDNSMFDAGTIGTTANKLLQLDGSTKIPAVDGSLLTGIPSSFTKNASDPTVSTNPSGGVGSLWANTTSGEVYICTDATAGANVWTNTGGRSGDVVPYVYQGSSYGYSAGGYHYSNGAAPYDGGGHPNIDKYAYASNANATDVGDMTIGRDTWSGHSSSTHGYACGGYSPGNYSPNTGNTIDRLSFASAGAI